MSWKDHASAALTDLQAALSARDNATARQHLSDALEGLGRALDAIEEEQ